MDASVVSAEGLEWVVFDSNELAPREGCPGRSSLSVSVEGWKDRGAEGQLHLVFFNDRLSSTIFYPDSVESYLEKLRAEGITLNPKKDQSKPHLIEPRTEVSSWVDADGGPYVKWYETALAKEDERWISAWS